MSEQLFALIDEFSEKLLFKLEKAYSDEIFSLLDNLPKPVVRFNNTEALKRAQMYVRHTNRLFSKQFAQLISDMFTSIGQQSKKQKDSSGDCVENHVLKTRFHFVNLEQLAGFRKDPLSVFSSTKFRSPTKDSQDVYVVLVKPNKQVDEYLESVNTQYEGTTYSYTRFDFFIQDHFGDEVLTHMKHTFEDIEQKASYYEWFELAKICTDTNLDEFLTALNDTLASFDYKQLIEDESPGFREKAFEIIRHNFIDNNRLSLLTGGNDFAKSFYTSEWLFSMNSKDRLLDKTYIITGYIKSVEQLLSYIVQSNASGHTISVQGRNGLVQVPVGSQESLSATLGNLVHFIKAWSSQDLFEEGIDRNSVNCISSIVQEWIRNERNGYFHKHNVSKNETVAQIRMRTILIHFLLLGSMKVS